MRFLIIIISIIFIDNRNAINRTTIIDIRENAIRNTSNATNVGKSRHACKVLGVLYFVIIFSNYAPDSERGIFAFNIVFAFVIKVRAFMQNGLFIFCGINNAPIYTDNASDTILIRIIPCSRSIFHKDSAFVHGIFDKTFIVQGNNACRCSRIAARIHAISQMDKAVTRARIH